MKKINVDIEYDIENLSEIESDSNDEIQVIDDYLDVDDKEADSSDSTDVNEGTLQKLLQQEMAFYSTAFPQATLSQKFLR